MTSSPISQEGTQTQSSHILIPFAYSGSFGDALQQQGLNLPNLTRLIGLASNIARLDGDELAPSLPHERLLTQWLGLAPLKGFNAEHAPAPMAALHAAQQGLWHENPALSSTGWAFITPCNWHVTPDRILLSAHEQLQLTTDQARKIFAELKAWFAQDDIELVWDTPDRWLAHSPLFGCLTTASLERVINRDVRQWLPSVEKAPVLQRLQTECQMLLYHLPMNDERAQQGLPSVNAFWVSGSGRILSAEREWQHKMALFRLVNELSTPAFNVDWQAWKGTWENLDNTLLADILQKLRQGQAFTLSLAGERSAISLELQPARSLWSSLKSQLRKIGPSPDAIRLLKSL